MVDAIQARYKAQHDAYEAERKKSDDKRQGINDAGSVSNISERDLVSKFGAKIE